MSFDSRCVLSSARTSPEPRGLEQKLGLAEAMGLSHRTFFPAIEMFPSSFSGPQSETFICKAAPRIATLR